MGEFPFRYVQSAADFQTYAKFDIEEEENRKQEEKRTQEEKHKQEEALQVGAQSSSHARTVFASLELLGTAYQDLRDQ